MSSNLDLSCSRQVTKDLLSFQMIGDNGSLDVNLLSKFVRSVKLSRCNVSYAVVAIMGPQSTGKSTLLNYLFSTNFDMMDPEGGRKQMTKGIWMAKAADVDPLTIVLDIEGNDGRERGQDHPFERQAAVFALALADIVLINMWCHDVGRDAGANKPLLRTVFEAMAQSFSPSKTTLLFVLRDRTKTPLSSLEVTVKDDLDKIWDGVKKREAYKNAALGDFFRVEFTSLCHYECQTDKFIEEAGELKKRFQNSIAPGGIAGDREGRVPGSAFVMSVETLWKSIQENKNLDLPNHKIMVANVRCQEIAKDKLSQLLANESWLVLYNAAKSGPVLNFGKQMSSIIASYLSQYDKEVMYFDKGVCDEIRRQFLKDICEVVKPTYDLILLHHLSQSKANFESQVESMLIREEGFAYSVRECKNSCLLGFDKLIQDVAVDQAAHWGSVHVKMELSCAIEHWSSTLCQKRLSNIVADSQKNLSEALEGAVVQAMEVMLQGDRAERAWPWIRAHLVAETDTATTNFRALVSGYELDNSALNEKLENIINHGRGVVERRAREEANRVDNHMKNRFTHAFSLGKDFLPRQWAADEDINSITQEARMASLAMLSDLAVIRLEKIDDNVEETLLCLMNEPTSENHPLKKYILGNVLKNPFSSGVSEHPPPLSTKTWENVPPSLTMITPLKCKTLWRQLLQDSVNVIRHAQQTQEANKKSDQAIKVLEAAHKEVLERQEEAAAAVTAKLKAVGETETAEAALKLHKAEAALELAKAHRELADAQADAANQLARAMVAEKKLENMKGGCSMF